MASPLRVSRFRAGGNESDAENEVYRLRVGSDLIVDVYANERLVVTHAATRMPAAMISHLLVDLVLPRLLSHDGRLVIHAGGVDSAVGGLLLMGLSGRGKSTLTTSFYQAGFGLLGDDAMVVSTQGGAPSLWAVYPSLRLFPDSVAALLPRSVTASLVSPHSQKHRIDLSSLGSVGHPVSLRAAFVLGEPDDDQITVRRLSLAETCMAIVQNSFALDPSDTTQAHRRLEAAGALARQIPAFEISYPRDYSRLAEVRHIILKRAAAVVPS